MSANLTRLGRLEKQFAKCEKPVVNNKGFALKGLGPVCAEIDDLMRAFVNERPETENLPETEFKELISEKYPRFRELQSGILDEIHEWMTRRDFPNRPIDPDDYQRQFDDGFDCLRGPEFRTDHTWVQPD